VKIALLTPGGVDRSGIHRVIPCVLWLIEELVAAGHEVHVFVPRQEAVAGDWPMCGARVHNGGRGGWRRRLLRAFRAEHHKARFDVIHALWAGMAEFGAVAGWLFRVPTVVTLAGGEPAAAFEIGYGGLTSVRGRFQLRLAAVTASHLTVPSDFMRGLALVRGVATTTIPLGVSLRHWPVSAPRERPIGAPLRLLHVASLNRVKDQPMLLEAMWLLKEAGLPFRLRIAGCDTLDGEIQRLAERLGLQRDVEFLGELDREVLRREYERSDMLVMSSRHEAGPLVMLEGALAGVPTVGTAVGHIADQAPHASLAVPVADAAALAQAIRDLAADEPRRLRLAETAQRFAARHDAAFTARAFGELYSSVAAR